MALAFFCCFHKLLLHSPDLVHHTHDLRRLLIIKRFHSIHEFLLLCRADFGNDAALFADGFLS